MAYLELAELQALNRIPMYMKDWVQRLDEFLKITGKDILQHAGSISYVQAMEKAEREYELYREATLDELSEVEKHFIQQIEQSAKSLNNKK